MKVSEKRCRFFIMRKMLSLKAEELGFHYAENEVKREKTKCSKCGIETTIGHPGSLHLVGLAVDVILYDKDWNYIVDIVPYSMLHEYWSSIGGNKMIKDDANHFSYPHGSVI